MSEKAYQSDPPPPSLQLHLNWIRPENKKKEQCEEQHRMINNSEYIKENWEQQLREQWFSWISI